MARAASPLLLVVAAVDAELDAVRSAMERHAVKGNVQYVTTGVGKASTARAVALALEKHHPALCIQAGSAGAFQGSGLERGDVVVALEEVFADEGVRGPEGFLDLSQVDLPLATARGKTLYNRIPVAVSPFLGNKENVAELGGRFNVRYGRMATVSTVSGTKEAARELEQRWKPLAEAMEGAAAALCCHLEDCPFMEIRGISNFVGERNRATWDLPTALEHAAEVVALLLESPGSSRLWKHPSLKSK